MKQETKEQLLDVKRAFIDIMENVDALELIKRTGLPKERCSEIYNLYLDLTRGS